MTQNEKFSRFACALLNVILANTHNTLPDYIKIKISILHGMVCDVWGVQRINYINGG